VALQFPALECFWRRTATRWPSGGLDRKNDILTAEVAGRPKEEAGKLRSTQGETFVVKSLRGPCTGNRTDSGGWSNVQSRGLVANLINARRRRPKETLWVCRLGHGDGRLTRSLRGGRAWTTAEGWRINPRRAPGSPGRLW